jgi:hypothetical protein
VKGTGGEGTVWAEKEESLACWGEEEERTEDALD